MLAASIYYKRLVETIGSNLLLKIIFKSTETLQLFRINVKGKGVNKVIKNAKL
jgi:hypothetical protein